eukprot:scaffold4510_cov183-Amphora_coffeaeformis.AAC.95
MPRIRTKPTNDRDASLAIVPTTRRHTHLEIIGYSWATIAKGDDKARTGHRFEHRGKQGVRRRWKEGGQINPYQEKG